MHVDQILRDSAPSSELLDQHVRARRDDVVALFTTVPTSAASAPHPRRRRISRAVIGATTAALIGAGGVAYATGLVPSFIDDELDRVSPSTVTDIHPIAALTVQGATRTRRFEIYGGTNADGQACTAVYEAVGNVGGPEFGGSCGDHPTDAWFDMTSESYRGGPDDTSPPSTYFVYGEPEIAGVESVRVMGAGFVYTVAVDHVTGGFAVAIPELTDGVRPTGTFATVDFLDQDGTVLGTREIAEK